jgi:hypothetical protein
VGFAVGGEVFLIDGFSAHIDAADQSLTQSSFYEQLTPRLTAVLNDLLAYTLEETWG